eukprot:g9733.t1 g9733   contig4:459310-460626(-)
MNSSQLLSGLPMQLFKDLISRPRALALRSLTADGVATAADDDDVDVETSADDDLHTTKVRDAILTKLQTNTDGGSITTVQDILRVSAPTLLRILDPCLTYVECNRLLSRIHNECSARPVSALEMLQRTAPKDDGKIPTGLPTLDSSLLGGFPLCSISELVGRAGVGKTHLAQQLCVLAAKSGFGGAVYIDTEKKLSLVRLRELAMERRCINGGSRKRGAEEAFASRNQHDAAQQVLENVTVHSLISTKELLDTLDGLGKEIIHRNTEAEEYKRGKMNNNTMQRLPVKLVVIDSIAAPVRRDFDMMSSSSTSKFSPNAATQRASFIFQVARKLKQLTHDHHLAVVVVNQVGSGGSDFRNNNPQRNNTLDIRDGEFTASLGTAWQYCVTTRIVMEHEDDPHKLAQEQDQCHQRKATITKSLVSKRAEVAFQLTSQGLCEV